MHIIFHQKLRATKTVATSVAALTVLLTGCTNAENAQDHTADPVNSASASASPSSNGSATSSKSAESSQSASSQPSASNSTKADAKDGNSSSASADTASSAEGSGTIKNGKRVALTDQNVVRAENLYGQFSDVLSDVKTKKVKEDSADAANSQQPVKEDIVLDTPSINQIKKVATGSAADEFTASAQEYGTSGWKQEGKTKFVGNPVIADTTYQGKAAKQLEVCVDSSQVTVKDSANKVLNSAKTSDRSLNIFTLVQENGSWKIAYRTMPDNPDC